MASCDVLALFTTPIHSGIKDSTSTFDGSSGRCSRSDQLIRLRAKKSPALPTFGQRNGSTTCGGFCFIPKSISCREENASLGCMNLKMRLKSSRKQKPRENKNLRENKRQAGWADYSNGSLASMNQGRAHFFLSFVGKAPENE